MSALPWAWRTPRFDDLQGCLVGLRGEEMVVGSGRLAGVWPVGRGALPRWVEKELAEKGVLAGRVKGGSLRRVGTDDLARIVAVGNGSTEEADGEPEGGDGGDALLFSAGGKIMDAPTGEMKGHWAQWYAGQNWPVFPLVAGKKLPFGGSRGFKDGVCGPSYFAGLEQHWKLFPRDGIGIVPGTADSKALVVVDIDPRRGGTLEQVKEAWGVADNWRVSTAGEGWHLYLIDVEGGCPSVGAGGFAEMPGIEVKSRGTFVVAPPTVLSDGTGYTWESFGGGAFDVVTDKMRGACKAARLKRSDLIPGSDDKSLWVDPDLLVESVANASEGNRNNTLYTAALTACQTTNKTSGDRAELLERLAQAALSTGLGSSGIRRTLDSASEGYYSEIGSVL